MKVLERQPDHFWASYCLAACSMRTRPTHYARAMAALTDCIHDKPEFPWPYLLRGLVNGEVGDFDTAYADFQAAGKLPLDDMARYALWVNRAAVSMRQALNHDERANSLRRLVPDLAQKEEKLAEPFFDAALPDLEAAVKLRPQQPQAYFALAAVHMRRERWAESAEVLAQAIDLAPTAALYRMAPSLTESKGPIRRPWWTSTMLSVWRKRRAMSAMRPSTIANMDKSFSDWKTTEKRWTLTMPPSLSAGSGRGVPTARRSATGVGTHSGGAGRPEPLSGQGTAHRPGVAGARPVLRQTERQRSRHSQFHARPGIGGRGG